MAVLSLLIAQSGARADVAGDLRAFLGGRSGKIIARDKGAGDKLYVFDLTSGSLDKLTDEINCAGPQISRDGTRVTYHQNGKVFLQPLGGEARTEVTTGYDPHWWTDPSGDEWIYYTTQGSFSSSKRKLWWPNNSGVETYRIRLKDSKKEKLWAWKGSSGPSPDGKYIGADYATMILYDTSAPKAWLLNNETQGCNGSMYPGTGKYLLMHLELPHDTFCYRDKNDTRVWFVKKPAGTDEWQHPEWSSDVDYATATAKESNTYYSAWVIKLSEINGGTGAIKSGAQGMMKVLDTAGGRDWAEPYLWVGAPPPTPKLALGSAALSFSVAEGGPAPAEQEVSVTNAGDGTLAAVSWEVAYGGEAGWLTVSRSGTGNSQRLVNTVDASGLSPNTYSATVEVSAAGAASSPQSYTVSLTVIASSQQPSEEPVIALSPTSRSFYALEGAEAPAPQQIALQNGGGGILLQAEVSVEYLSGAGWLAVSGQGAGDDQVLVNAVSPAGLVLNTYSAMVSVSVANAPNSPQRYTVSLTVTDELPALPPESGGSPMAQDAGVGLAPDAQGGPALENALLGGCSLAAPPAEGLSLWLLCGLFAALGGRRRRSPRR